MSYNIHWFRRDLRIAGNQSLKWSWKASQGRTLGIFCFDKKFLSRDDFSANRFQLFIDTLSSLRDEMRACGSDLLFLDIGPKEAFPYLIDTLNKSQLQLPTSISFSQDYEPFSRHRDQAIKQVLEAHNIPTHVERDHLLIEPHELSKPDDTGYQVYSPFARKWLEIFSTEEIQKRIEQQKRSFRYLRDLETNSVTKIFSLTWSDLFNGSLPFDDFLSIYRTENLKKTTIPIPETGTMPILKKLKEFEKKIDSYGEKRDYPDLNNTSRFSTYLKNGSLTVPQIIAYYNLQPYLKKKTGRDIFFSELIWREFYYHILFRHPNVEQEAFLEKYRHLNWENNSNYFEAWKKGMTGFPIVDAGMRELSQTGWMHNRVRMIVASFLTKDLLIDWKWGEQYFMDQLLDGDLAPNNGGWQWAASTGCDPQPYFRIFNPWLQSAKFDKEGTYIKKYLPELEDIPSKKLHAPIIGHPTYPEPIVDHKTQREKALALYKIDN